MIANKGKSQKNEIYNFYKDVNKPMDVSQTAFYNARMKFNPEALLTIMKDLIKEEYDDPENLVTLNGYYVMAIDGSDFVFPNTESNKEKYGEAKADSYGNAKTMSSISTIFDCINKLFLDVSIQSFKYSERKSASKHLNEVQKIVPNQSKYLTIFDRGYAGIKLIDQMIDAEQKFLMRLPNNVFKREQNQLNSETLDKWIDLEYDRLRTNDFRNDRSFRMKLMNTKYNLRFVKVPLIDKNSEEISTTFVTNLSDEEFDSNAIYELYHLRWEIETSYRSLKSQLNTEEFSGYRDTLIKQDIYAGAFVHNAVSMTISENKEVKKVPEDRYKYEMKVNRNFALGVLKKDLLMMFVLYKNKKAAKKAQEEFEKNMVKHSCPTRNNRSNKRIVKGVNKSKLSYRRSY